MRVWIASTVPGQSFLPEEFWLGQEREIREELMPVAETWIVEEEGEIVAFIALLGHLIGGLFTHPDHQGMGHGRRLVAHAQRCSDLLLVEVFEANVRAIGFYRRCGFVEHERIVEEASGLPLLVMRLGHQGAT